jgi:Rod binding domain-containing protein
VTVASATSGLPAIADTALPAAVRNGSDEDKKAYKAAMGFEQMMLQSLIGELAKSSSSSASDGGDDDESGLGSSSGGGLLGGGGPWASQIQETLAQQLASGGGIGLAQQLYTSLKPDGAAADETSVMPASTQNATSA